MVWTVDACSRVLAAVGGFLQFAPVWHPLTTGSRRSPRRSPRRRNRAGGGRVGRAVVARRSPGSGVAWLLYSRQVARRSRSRSPLLEHKFYWDELYDAIFYRPADLARARRSRRFVERPLIAGSIGEVTRGFALRLG